VRRRGFGAVGYGAVEPGKAGEVRRGLAEHGRHGEARSGQAGGV